MEAMRSAEPGMYEYELEAIADYVFKKNNAQGIAYFALVAAGKNAAWPHYHAAQTRTKDGDLVLFDYAPDYKYYTSDVTRMFPVNGKFTPDQRELYTHLREALPGAHDVDPSRARSRDILQDVVRKMDAVMAAYRFTNPRNQEAAARFVGRATARRRRRAAGPASATWSAWKCTTSTVPYDELKPGMIFTIEPAMTIPDERVYVRLEDVILITPDRLREPVGARAGRGRGHREADGGEGHRAATSAIGRRGFTGDQEIRRFMVLE